VEPLLHLELLQLIIWLLLVAVEVVGAVVVVAAQAVLFTVLVNLYQQAHIRLPWVQADQAAQLQQVLPRRVTIVISLV
jgi:hypothetical protein